MATQLFLIGGNGPTPSLIRGENTAKLDGTNSGWTAWVLSTTRGGSAVASSNTNTVAGPTSGVEAIASSLPLEFISAPAAADVTISGDITANVWASESASGANVAINVVIDIIRGNDMSIVNIVQSTRTTEVAVTTRAVNNFTTGMTSGAYSSQTLNKGDRLRVRVVGDDAGTMGAALTFNFSWNSSLAAIDGDTYVTFTENITFEDVGPPPTTRNLEFLWGARATNISGVGRFTSTEKIAQSFVPPFDFTLVSVAMTMDLNGTPVDSLKVSVQTDSGGSGPTGTILDSTTTTPDAFSNVNIPLGQRSGFVFTGGVTLSGGTTYWLVCERTGAIDGVNFWGWSGNTGTNDYVYPSGQQAVYDGATWSLLTNDKCFDFDLGNRIYLTDAASEVSTASVDREAWKQRGSGGATDVTNTAAGFGSPIQVTDTAGGTAVDWFTKQLTGFTLSGMAYFRVDGFESAASANAALRVEIARVDSDGTNPTVWGTAGLAMLFGNQTNQGELGSTDFFPAWAFPAGDDLVITDGQRLRLRIYIDDSQNAMGAGQTVTTYYNRALPGGIGDTFVIFPQTLNAFVTPQLVPGRRMSWFS